MANSVDPYPTPRSATSDLGLYCLLKVVCPNTQGQFGTHTNAQADSDTGCSHMHKKPMFIYCGRDHMLYKY